MSQTKLSLNKIASGEEYKALVAAVEKADHQTAINSYLQVSKQLEDARKEILGRIQGLTRQNKDEDGRKFQAAFDLRAKAALPQWDWFTSELKKQRIMEGEVQGIGSKGDPLVRTPEGRTVVVPGAPQKEGERVRFQVVNEGANVDFGRVFELTPDSFYRVISQGTRDQIRDSLNSLRERLDSYKGGVDEKSLADLSQLLKELEDVRELASRLRAEERDLIVERISGYRRRLLGACTAKLAFELLRQDEEKEIAESVENDASLLTAALAAPGLLRYQAYKDLKSALFSGDNLKDYDQIRGRLEHSLESMNAAMELMEFQTAIEEVLPAAKRYFQIMDRFFQKLVDRAKGAAFKMAEDKLFKGEDINSAVKSAISAGTITSELRSAFQSQEDFFAMRAALAEVMTKVGNTAAMAEEAAIRPYLRSKLAAAFGSTASPAQHAVRLEDKA